MSQNDGWTYSPFPRHPSIQPLPRFIPCVYGTQRVISTEQHDYPHSVDEWPFGELTQQPPAPLCLLLPGPSTPPTLVLSQESDNGLPGVSTEGGGDRVGDAVTILGTHFSALFQG